jgi:putative transcriptional regulator
VRKRLIAARKAAGLTQKQMAEKLGFKSESHYCMIENGKRGVSVGTAIKLSRILKRTVEELFYAELVNENETREVMNL